MARNSDLTVRVFGETTKRKAEIEVKRELRHQAASLGYKLVGSPSINYVDEVIPNFWNAEATQEVEER